MKGFRNLKEECSGAGLLPGYALFAVAIRFLTYFPTVIDSDESTYILMADAVLYGAVPFVDYIDIKPVGIYLIFAGMLGITGGSIAGVRIIASLFVALTAWLLTRTSFQLTRKRDLSVMSGLAYIIAGSLHKWSWSANTEIFFCFFTILALLLLLRAKDAWHYFLFGLMLGLGFMIKYLVLFDYAAFILFAFFWTMKDKKTLQAIVLLGLSFAGFVLPFAGTALTYFLSGYWEEFAFVTFAIPSAYRASPAIGDFFEFLAEFYLSLLPLSICYFGMLFLRLKQFGVRDKLAGFGLIWFLLVWFGIYFTGKTFFHYYFQALVPLCLFFPLLLDSSIEWIQKTKQFLIRYRFPIILASAVLVLTVQWVSLRKPDYPFIIAEDLNKELKEGDEIFILYRNIIYHLTDRMPPTPYLHSSIFIFPELAQAYNVDPGEAFNRIMSKEPRFCVVESDIPPGLQGYLESNYVQVRIYNNKIFLWEKGSSQ